jgi:hypothetical protein
MEFAGSFLFESDKPWLIWEGIVAPRTEWPRDDEGLETREQLKNWAYRVKVRIQHVHPEDKKILPDSALPWIEVPTTIMGSGHKGTGITPGITQGTRVWGIWGSPSTKTNPIMLGVKVNNDQTKLVKTQPTNAAFTPYSGYTPEDTVAGYDVPLAKGLPLEGINYPNIWSISDLDILDEPKFAVAAPSDCEKIPLRGIQKAIQGLIQDIEKTQRQLKRWQNAAQGWIADKQAYIQKLIDKAAKFIAKALKWVFEEIRKFVLEQINDKTKKLYYLVNPPDRDKVKAAKDTVVELIVCLFNKLIANLIKMVGRFLFNAFDKFITVPECVVENFIGNLLGNVLGLVGGLVDKILGTLSSILGAVFSIADGILGLLKAILGFFLCDEKQECPQAKEWDIFEAGEPGAIFDFDSIISKAKSISASVAGLSSIDDLNINFSNMISGAGSAFDSCNTGPVFCGPPSVQIWGGGGSGAVGNAIISATGDLLGVDIIAGGSGYTEAPYVNFKDSCGKGKGGRGRVIVNDDGTGNGTSTVSNVVILDEGYGYLPSPNGDLGGDGRTWATNNQTVVQRVNGSYDVPYDPGEEITPELRDGDRVIRPEDRTILNTIAVLGGGSNNPINFGPTNTGIAGSSTGSPSIGFAGTDTASNNIATPPIPGSGVNGATDFKSFPRVNVGSYPVILYLCGIDIENAGINYSSEDKIVIEPNTGGAVVEPIFGPFGVLTGINIVDGGKGFTERPSIYINSETGYNAKLNPIFCVSRFGDDTEGEVPENVNVIRVVDCVGKV